MTPRVAVVACLLAAAALAVPLAMAAPTAVGPPAALGSGVGAQDDSAEGVSPGERVSGAIGAEQAELDGEVRERRFGIRLDRAETDADRAGVVGDELDAVGQRLTELDERLETLEQRRERGEITRGQYASNVARIEAERRSLERRLERSEASADRLPDDARVGSGADRERVQTLRQHASELGGQEVREIARGIAGQHVGDGTGPPAHVPGNGPGAGNATGVGPPGHARASPNDADDPDS